MGLGMILNLRIARIALKLRHAADLLSFQEDGTVFPPKAGPLDPLPDPWGSLSEALSRANEDLWELHRTCPDTEADPGVAIFVDAVDRFVKTLRLANATPEPGPLLAEANANFIWECRASACPGEALEGLDSLNNGGDPETCSRRIAEFIREAAGLLLPWLEAYSRILGPMPRAGFHRCADCALTRRHEPCPPPPAPPPPARRFPQRQARSRSGRPEA
jgi:hypothetical protein